MARMQGMSLSLFCHASSIIPYSSRGFYVIEKHSRLDEDEKMATALSKAGCAI
jgi:hypothetical protein